MQAGDFNRIVSIDRPVVSNDATYGSAVTTWERLATFAAQVEDALPSRSESVQQGLVLGRNQTRLRMRYRSDIDASMRVIVHGDSDVVYQIVGGPAEIGGRRVGLELMLERFSS